jgi:hypothetical protein
VLSFEARSDLLDESLAVNRNGFRHRGSRNAIL